MVLGEERKDNSEVSSEFQRRSSTPKLKQSEGRASAVSSDADDVRNRVLSFIATKKKTNRQNMVIEAIAAISNYERGASLQAIMKWIMANYASNDVNRLKVHIKGIISKALEDGIILRAETSKGAKGTLGSFVLSKTSSKTKLRKKAGKVDRKKVKDDGISKKKM